MTFKDFEIASASVKTYVTVYKGKELVDDFLINYGENDPDILGQAIDKKYDLMRKGAEVEIFSPMRGGIHVSVHLPE